MRYRCLRQDESYHDPNQLTVKSEASSATSKQRNAPFQEHRLDTVITSLTGRTSSNPEEQSLKVGMNPPAKIMASPSNVFTRCWLWQCLHAGMLLGVPCAPTAWSRGCWSAQGHPALGQLEEHSRTQCAIVCSCPIMQRTVNVAPVGFGCKNECLKQQRSLGTFNTAPSQTGWTRTLLLLVLLVVNFSPLVFPLFLVNLGKN